MAKLLKALFLALLLIAFTAGGYLFWASDGVPASDGALVAMQSDQQVLVSDGSWITFTPVSQAVGAGIIFYPGAQVDPRGYAPLMRELASRGYLAVIARMPFNLAVMDINRAEAVMAAHPNIDGWVIAGHSLGGVMAAQFVADYQGEVSGLGLLAAYAATDISSHALAVSSIYGSLDEAATPAEIEAAAQLLPANTRYIPIEGGDHYQFGDFAEAPRTATIALDQQQQQTLAALLQLMK
jgi:pimeloyl-ACP methyl ester carboxylesterase